MTEETLKKVIRLIKDSQKIAQELIDEGKAEDIFFIDDEPNPRIIEIGEELSNIGGIDLMQEAYYEIIKPFGSNGPNLKWAWNNVGNWRV